MPPGEARRRARAELGSVEAVKDGCREVSGLAWIDELRRNLAYALRQLVKSPGFSLTAIAILALSIGANAAVFSVVDAVLLRRLPYPEPDRLALVATRFDSGAEQMAQDGRAWEAIREGASGLDVAVYSPWAAGANFSAGGQAEQVGLQRVGAGFFRVLGVAPAAGRGFTAGEDLPGGPPVVVLSHPLAVRVAGAASPGGDGGLDPGLNAGLDTGAALGRRVLLRGEPHTVVGVMPEGFRTATPADLWTPLRPTTTGEGGGTNYGILARLPPGTDWARAEAEIERASTTALAERPFDSGTVARLGLVELQRGLTGGQRGRLLRLWAAVGLVLAIGCVNVAGLLLARGAARRREVATRMALGGGRGAVVRQFLTESLVLAGAGGLAGVGLGWAGLGAVRALAADSFGVWQTVQLDLRVLAVAAALTLGAAVLCGLFPALQATRLDLGAAAGGRVAGARNHWPRRALVVVEVALGVVLLVAAGLLLRTLGHLEGIGPGFDPEGVLAGRMPLADARYATRDEIAGLFERGLTRIRRVPGVEAAGTGLSAPFERALNMPFTLRDGEPEPEREITTLVYVTPGYLEALGLPLLQGRRFEEGDGPEAGRVAVVNRAFVEEYLAGGALGVHLDLADEPRRIVGVVGDVLQVPSWGDYEPIDAVPAVYLPLAQTSDELLQLVHTWFSPSWVVRTAAGRGETAADLDAAVRAAAPEIPFAGFHPVERGRARLLADDRLQARLYAAAAAVALLLAAVGIGGLIASSVTERTRELGIRMALGSTPARALRTMALPGIALAGVGIALGSLGALAAGRALRGTIHGIGPHDPATFATAALLLLAVATVASLLPALRAARIDPARTLRQE